jgi:hypothetical protein
VLARLPIPVDRWFTIHMNPFARYIDDPVLGDTVPRVQRALGASIVKIR